MFTNKKRADINTFVCAISIYVVETPETSINEHELPLPIISFGIVAYGFVGQPLSKQLYTRTCARIDIRVYAKYARIKCVCAVRIYLSCTVGVRSRKNELGRGEKDKKQCYSPGHGVQHANQKATTPQHLIKHMYSWKLRKT